MPTIEVKNYKKTWRDKNKDKLRRAWRAYYLKNKERITQRTKDWKSNKEGNAKTVLARASRKYTQTPKGIYLCLKNNAKRKNREVLSRDSFIGWYEMCRRVCYYCGIPEGSRRLSIDRMNNELGYLDGNIVLACDECNKVKSNILTVDEMKLVGELIMKKRWLK